MSEQEELVYKAEQAMLSPGEKDCPACKGNGCELCDQRGKYWDYFWSRARVEKTIRDGDHLQEPESLDV